ncbi:hypothetical protein [Streptomyces rimosus]|uniref:hypothetical protein n=1 Tax=Streptomyces rimosus TaxID=1927 RepID=UPI0037ABA0CB
MKSVGGRAFAGRDARGGRDKKSIRPTLLWAFAVWSCTGFLITYGLAWLGAHAGAMDEECALGFFEHSAPLQEIRVKEWPPETTCIFADGSIETTAGPFWFTVLFHCSVGGTLVSLLGAGVLKVVRARNRRRVPGIARPQGSFPGEE